MAWNDSERVLETPSDFAGEVGADFVGLKPGGAFHISCIILKKPKDPFSSFCSFLWSVLVN